MPKKHHLSFLIASFILMLFSGIYEHDLISRGEGREALVAQSILKNNEWILPQGYSGEIPSKPPFLHWFSAAISLPLGEVNDITVRLPSAFFSLCLILLFYRFLSKRFSERLSFYTCAMLFTSLEFYRASTVCRVDMVFCVMIFMSILCFYKWKEADLKGIPFLTILFLCAATLCKGPAGIILPGCIFFIWLYTEKVPLGRNVLTNGTILFTAFFLSLTWYAAAYSIGGEAFLHKVYDENVARFLGNMDDESHQHNAPYLWGMYLLGLFPWSLILILPFFISLYSGRLKLKLRELGSFEKLSLITIAVFLVFFSIPSSKRGVYLLPAYPFTVFFLAKFLEYVENNYSRLLSQTIFTIKISILMISIFMISIYVWPEAYSSLTYFQKEKNSFLLDIPKTFYLNRGLLWIIPVFYLYFFIITFNRKSALNFICILVLFVSSLQVLLIIPYSTLFSPKFFAFALNDKFENNERMYSYMNEFYALSFYMKRQISRYKPGSSLDDGILVIYEDKIQDAENALGRRPEVLLMSENNVEKPQKKLIALK